MRNIFYSVLSFLFTSLVFAQVVKPENGVKESAIETVILRNCEIVVSPNKTISKGSIVLKGGEIKAIGAIIPPQDLAIEYDMKGKTIVPAFIESYANYGVVNPKGKTWNPRPQIESSKNGAFYWNEAVHPEIDASTLFKRNFKESERLQKMGFGVAVSHQKDGIARGTGVAVALGKIEANEAIIDQKVGSFFSFSKGVSRQTYPSSQMGSIALLRQMFEDAIWYKANKETVEKNLSLEALNEQLDNGTLVFYVTDKLEILRAEKLAKEYGYDITVVGAGNEYERLDKFDSNSSLIIPINFPKAYEVKDPYVARQIPLSDLKHWELAPSNPYFLATQNVNFSITSNNCKDAAVFWKNLRKAIERGLTREDAIAALTVNPAKIYNLEKDFGTLEKGKKASFTVFTKDPFVYKDAQLLESWSLGNQEIYHTEPKVDLRGDYVLNIESHNYDLSLKGSKEKLTGKVISYKMSKDSLNNPQKDTLKAKVFANVQENDITLQFNLEDDNYTGSVTLHAKANTRLGVFEGQGLLPTGKWVKWSGIKKKAFKEDKKEEQIIEIDSISRTSIWYPNMSYGYDTIPQKETYVLKNASVWTNESAGVLKNATVIIKDGKIDFVGKENVIIPLGAKIYDASEMHITTGIIDEHSHIAISKGVNESGQAVSAEVSIADVVRSDDINIYRQLSGGVTASQLLHGSANPIGGRSALVKLKWGSDPEEMLIDNAPKFIKFALGENVKQSNWGNYNTVRFPQTRMGVEQVFYDAFIRAKAYHANWEKYNNLSAKKRAKLGLKAPAKDLELEAVWEIVNSERFITCHSYVQSEINMLMHVADSMGFTVNTFTHILEGYKLADKLKAHGAGGSTFADWWAYKYEVNDAIPYNASLMAEQGIVVAINSDDAEMGRRLNQEAGKVIKYGGATEEEALKMVTLNPAKLLHLNDKMGSIKVGKDADVVVWSAHPLSIAAKVQKTFVDGELLYDVEIDAVKRKENKVERARIISSMLDAKTKGEATKVFVKKEHKHYHCDTIGE